MTRRDLLKLIVSAPLLMSKSGHAEMGEGINLPESTRGIGCPAIMRGSSRRKQLALTFDDGPEPILTARLLNTLKSLGIKATFFVIGEKVDKHPDLVQKMIAEGHEVENHSYYHLRMARIPKEMVTWEIQQGAKAIERAVGKRPLFMRPPGGEFTAQVAAACAQQQSILALWSQDPADYEQPSHEVITQRLLHTTRNGGIILLHEKVRPTMQALPAFAASARERGYEFVRLDEMWKHRG